MFKINKTSACILGAVLMISCGRAEETASLKGHFAPYDEERQPEFKGKQAMIPEIKGVPVQSVVVGLPLITRFNKMELIQKILETQVEEVVVMTPWASDATISGRDVANKGFRYFLERPGFKPVEFPALPDGKRVRVIRALRGEAVASDAGEELQTVWARDWAPLSAKDRETGALRFIDFNYYPDRKIDDTVSESLELFYGRPDFVPRVPIPLYFEGGNFTMDGAGNCFISDSTLRHNDWDGPASNDKAFDEGQVLQQFKDFVGCETTEIITRLPFEGTGHLDMWMKFIDDKNVIVGQIPPIVTDLSHNDSREFDEALQKVSSHLDAYATYLQERYNVVRIPMPAPIFRRVQGDGESYVVKGAFRSYTNSLLLDKHIIVPLYNAPSKESIVFQHPDVRTGEYPDADHLKKWTAQVRKIYESFGLKVSFVDSDSLIEKAGAIHCVTMQIPKIN